MAARHIDAFSLYSSPARPLTWRYWLLHGASGMRCGEMAQLPYGGYCSLILAVAFWPAPCGKVLPCRSRSLSWTWQTYVRCSRGRMSECECPGGQCLLCHDGCWSCSGRSGVAKTLSGWALQTVCQPPARKSLAHMLFVFTVGGWAAERRGRKCACGVPEWSPSLMIFNICQDDMLY